MSIAVGQHIQGVDIIEKEYRLYVGVDWAFDDHQVCVIDSERRVLHEKKVEHSGTGLSQFADWLATLAEGDNGSIAVGIEVPRGSVVEALLERGFHVFSINPKQMDRFRDRHSVAGAKDDPRDAFVLSDSLRTDRPAFYRLRTDDPLTIQLRELTRLDEDLQIDLGRLCNRLREQLHRFFPQMLRLSASVNTPVLWDLVELIPEPKVAYSVKTKQVDKLLRERRIRRLKTDEILATLRTPAIQVAPGTVEAARAHIELILPIQRLLHANRRECSRRIGKLLAEFPCTTGDEQEQREHRDVDIILSLPGAGNAVAATVLAEASQPVAERDYHALRTQSGIAPVTKASGKKSRRRAVVIMRRACKRRLRWSMYHWARVAVQTDSQFRARYASLRSRGHSHGRALRAVGDRLLRVLVAMLNKGTLYDARLPHGPGIPPASEA